MRSLWLAALALAVITPLVLINTDGAPLREGDEAIYAQMAREMAASGNFADLMWQGEVQFPRPPGAIWTLALAQRLLGPGERAVRWPLAAAAGLEVALVLLLGTALFRPAVGVVAAGALATSDLFLGYARYFESEPILCCAVVGAFCFYARARTRPQMVWGWGALFGCALLTKQMVGALPLLAPLCDQLTARAERVPAGAIARGLAAATVVALPWHLQAVIRHGMPFVDSFFWHNVVQRSSAPLLGSTRPTFYLRELWRSEGPLCLLSLAAVARCAYLAARRRSFADLLIAGWAVAVLVIYSAARSRADHYALLCYPALALAVAALLCQGAPSPRLGGALALLYIGVAGALHLPRNLAGFGSEAESEVRQLAQLASARARPPARLYTYNTHAYEARYYSTLEVSTLLESADDMAMAAELRAAGQPNSVVAAPDLPAALRALPRPFALLMPRARRDQLAGAPPLRPLGETRHFLLLLAPPATEAPPND